MLACPAQVLAPTYRLTYQQHHDAMAATQPALVMCDVMNEFCIDAACMLQLPLVMALPTLFPGGGSAGHCCLLPATPAACSAHCLWRLAGPLTPCADMWGQGCHTQQPVHVGSRTAGKRCTVR